MNIFELESFNLADAVKFHDRLNHRLWDSSEHLHPQVKERLMAVARDFQEFLGVPDLDVKDITVSGSNAAYNYTDGSDIDLHLVVEIPDVAHDEVYRELFNAKKYQYNEQHNIRIGGADVELYAQPSDQPHHSQGIYSLLRNAWIQVPRRRKVTIDDSCVQAKYQDLKARIESAVDSGDSGRMRSLQQKIKTMRQTGLEQQGEFGCDNLVFKMLRAHGAIKRLIDARNDAHARELSLAEKNTTKAPVVYGFMSESPDGVDPSTKMFLEAEPTDTEQTVRDFIDYAAEQLGITQLPQIELHSDPEWSSQSHSFGRYTPETHTLEVSLANRHVMDILRTTAHELAHCRQNQDSELPDEAGETGSDWENQAHAVAGVIMRNWADRNPAMFESSGYIPTEAEKNDPRFEMALTQDVRPGATGLNANRMSLKTDAQGRPQMLRADGKVNMVEYRMPQPSKGPNNNRDLNAPLGPETPPKMPAGTIKVDVSDMYDWYKLGQKISDLKSIDKSDLGVGPPSTVFAFGSEDLENMYSHQLTNLGLKTHDLDEPGEEDIDENFADGRNPQDKGDAKRHGINTKASVSSLRKTAKQGGRKGQLAHWLANMKSGRARAKRKNESLDEVRINNSSGVGAVPHNADVDYFGLQVAMRPSMFLKLALPMDPHDPEERKAVEFCKSELNERGIGAPFLNVSVPEAWEQGDFSQEARVKGHDGRHRCYAILEKEGDDAIEMHIFIAHTRRRDITDEMIENLRNGILNQLGQFVRGPIFGEAK